jgi:hypothetical protein
MQHVWVVEDKLYGYNILIGLFKKETLWMLRRGSENKIKINLRRACGLVTNSG